MQSTIRRCRGRGRGVVAGSAQLFVAVAGLIAGGRMRGSSSMARAEAGRRRGTRGLGAVAGLVAGA